MDKFFLINQELNDFTDTVLEEKFREKNPVYGKVNYYPIFASRLPFFKNILLEEAIDAKNRVIPFFNFIRISWIPVLCVLDYSDDIHFKQEIIKHIKHHWTANEIDNFKTYMQSRTNWLLLF